MRLLKASIFFVATLIFLFASKNQTLASLVVVGSDGEVTMTVLSVEDSIELEIPRAEYLEVKNVAESAPDQDAKISLFKKDGKVNLNVSTNSGDKSLDVTNYKDAVIEIEKRPQAEKITIGILGENFTISQRGVVVETDYEINIDPKSADLTLSTPSGLRYLSILPRQAVDTILRSNTINRITRQNKVFLVEQNGGGDLSYKVSGEKVINLFDLFEYSVPVTSYVSASTGEILSTEQPEWLRVLGFLFV